MMRRAAFAFLALAPALACAATQGPEGRWEVVRSAYGTHLVEVERRTPESEARLEEVREAVRKAWLAEQRENADRALLQRLRAKYDIRVDDLPAAVEAHQ